MPLLFATFCFFNLVSAPVVNAAPGELDVTFGNGGTASHVIGQGGNVTVYKVVIQPDGKIIVVGRLKYPSLPQYLFLRRYTPTGSLDAAYDGPHGTSLREGIGYDAEVQADGKVVVIGGAPNSIPLLGGGVYNTTSPVVWRFNSNLTRDTSFDTDGAKFINTIAVGNYHIEVFGTRIIIGYAGRSPNVVPVNTAYKFARINKEGVTDFSRSLTFQFYTEKAFSLKVDPLNGDIVTGGVNKTTGEAVIRRYTIDNAVASGFGLNGEAEIPDCAPSLAELLPKDMSVLTDGKFLVYRWRGLYSDISVSQMTADGSADTVCVFSFNAPPEIKESLFVQPDGKFFYTLQAFYSALRYFPDGTADDYVHSIGIRPSAIQPDQKIVAAWGSSGLLNMERRLLN
jgi:uncharacterized delta-60 repeat protein